MYSSNSNKQKWWFASDIVNNNVCWWPILVTLHCFLALVRRLIDLSTNQHSTWVANSKWFMWGAPRSVEPEIIPWFCDSDVDGETHFGDESQFEHPTLFIKWWCYCFDLVHFGIVIKVLEVFDSFFLQPYISELAFLFNRIYISWCWFNRCRCCNTEHWNHDPQVFGLFPFHLP